MGSVETGPRGDQPRQLGLGLVLAAEGQQRLDQVSRAGVPARVGEAGALGVLAPPSAAPPRRRRGRPAVLSSRPRIVAADAEQEGVTDLVRHGGRDPDPLEAVGPVTRPCLVGRDLELGQCLRRGASRDLGGGQRLTGEPAGAVQASGPQLEMTEVEQDQRLGDLVATGARLGEQGREELAARVQPGGEEHLLGPREAGAVDHQVRGEALLEHGGGGQLVGASGGPAQHVGLGGDRERTGPQSSQSSSAVARPAAGGSASSSASAARACPAASSMPGAPSAQATRAAARSSGSPSAAARAARQCWATCSMLPVSDAQAAISTWARAATGPWPVASGPASSAQVCGSPSCSDQPASRSRRSGPAGSPGGPAATASAARSRAAARAPLPRARPAAADSRRAMLWSGPSAAMARCRAVTSSPSSSSASRACVARRSSGAASPTTAAECSGWRNRSRPPSTVATAAAAETAASSPAGSTSGRVEPGSPGDDVEPRVMGQGGGHQQPAGR